MRRDATIGAFTRLILAATKKRGIGLSGAMADKLGMHYCLMLKWNRTTNLTRITDLEKSLSGHYLDCLVGLERVPRDDLEDVGSGAGFPGLIAAITWPTETIELIETSQKRCTFLELCIKQLGLANCSVRKARVEQLEGLSRVTSRATFSPETLDRVAGAIKSGGWLHLWVNCTQELEVAAACSRAGMLFRSKYIYLLDEGPERAILGFQKK